MFTNKKSKTHKNRPVLGLNHRDADAASVTTNHRGVDVGSVYRNNTKSVSTFSSYVTQRLTFLLDFLSHFNLISTTRCVQVSENTTQFRLKNNNMLEILVLAKQQLYVI